MSFKKLNNQDLKIDKKKFNLSISDRLEIKEVSVRDIDYNRYEDEANFKLNQSKSYI